ncbi:hypothetical protein A4A49_36303 [Nicotiana attenuata]|uniref:Uncharacterized protein n=1 Tax=Nicotiana attenuata TaxID=49451 RepID=A0A1J6KTP2_NICAT|nr:hypothetical protein A4A49_36303 [Nicotiana attenuata]
MNRANMDISVGNAFKIDKGPPKPTRDVPAKTALVTMRNALNPVVQAYDNLHSIKDAIVASTAVTIDRADASVQIGKDTNDNIATGDRRFAIDSKAVNVEAKHTSGQVESEQGTLAKHTVDQSVFDPKVKSSGQLTAAGAQNASSAQFDTSTNKSVIQATSLDAAGDIQATDMVEAGSQHGQQSLAKGWFVVHRSPSNKVFSDHKNLEAAAQFKYSNSFDALASAHEHGEKDLQHKEVCENSKTM